jgi:hypothetical protein
MYEFTPEQARVMLENIDAYRSPSADDGAELVTENMINLTMVLHLNLMGWPKAV